MEDCSTDEQLRQEMLCHRQWTDEYVERPRDTDEAERSRHLASVSAGRRRQTWLRLVEDDLRQLNFDLATARRRVWID